MTCYQLLDLVHKCHYINQNSSSQQSIHMFFCYHRLPNFEIKSSALTALSVSRLTSLIISIISSSVTRLSYAVSGKNASISSMTFLRFSNLISPSLSRANSLNASNTSSSFSVSLVLRLIKEMNSPKLIENLPLLSTSHSISISS